MNPRMKTLVFLSTILIGLLLAAVAMGIWTVESKSVAEVRSISKHAQEAYLWKRFDNAYQEQPPAVAVWEGTNLAVYLEQHAESLTNITAEQGASRVFLYARISLLFTELGDHSKAQDYAKKTLDWFQRISSAKDTLTEAQAVREALARDRVRRK